MQILIMYVNNASLTNYNFCSFSQFLRHTIFYRKNLNTLKEKIKKHLIIQNLKNCDKNYSKNENKNKFNKKTSKKLTQNLGLKS